MPTIEIISFGAKSLRLDQNNYDFKIVVNKKMKSHRNLFQDYLDKYNGVIAHLGNKNQIGEHICFANSLLDGDFIPENNDFDECEYFKFSEEYREKINELLEIALKKSPISKAAFLTDYQFGGDKKGIENIISIKNYWERHDENGLIFNTLYKYGEK